MIGKLVNGKLVTEAIAAILFLVLLAACDKTPPPPLVFGTHAWSGYEPVFLAQDLGYLPSGRINLVEYAAPSEVEQAFRSGTLHVAAMTLEEALLLRRDVPELKIILFPDMRTADKTLDVMVVRDESIGKFHRELLALIQGWQRALDYERSEPAKAAAAMAQREHIDAAQFAREMLSIERYDVRRNRELMIGEPPPVAGGIDAMQRAMINRGALQVGAETTTLVDTTLLSEADKNGHPESGVQAP